jgi:hypothetical protein
VIVLDAPLALLDPAMGSAISYCETGRYLQMGPFAGLTSGDPLPIFHVMAGEVIVVKRAEDLRHAVRLGHPRLRGVLGEKRRKRARHPDHETDPIALRRTAAAAAV